MRHLALAVLLSLWAMSAPAQQSQIEGVIGAQLDAFEADDFERAFTYASPTIQGIFGGPDRFGAMVRQGYPMVHRPGDVQFGDLTDLGTIQRQRVVIQDLSGRFFTLAYDMIETEDGWKINGVQILPSPQVGA